MDRPFAKEKGLEADRLQIIEQSAGKESRGAGSKANEKPAHLRPHSFIKLYRTPP
jgi:hypothetical protein